KETVLETKEREQESSVEQLREQAAAQGATAARPQVEGMVLQVIGPVVDVEFPAGAQLPEIYDALEKRTGTEAEPKETDEKGDGQAPRRLVLEVQQSIGENAVRTISMQSTDGLRRGDKIVSTGGPIKVPVGEPTLG